jgi:hypothetical protein
MRHVLIASSFAATAWAAAAGAQDVVSWASPTDAAFLDAAHWSPARVPGVLDVARLGLAAPYAVVLDGPASVSAVELENPQAVLRLVDAAELQLDSCTGPGVVRLESSGIALRTRLIVTGGGVIDARVDLLVAPGAQTGSILTHGGGPPAVIGPQGVVSGHALLQGDWHNAGLFDVSGGTLELRGGDLTQEPTGRIRVRGGADLRIDERTVRGGVLELEPDAEVQAFGGVLDGVTIEGLFTLRAGRRIDLEGEVFFDEILMNGTDSAFSTTIVAGDGAILHGHITIAGRAELPRTTVLQQKIFGGVAVLAADSVVSVTSGTIDDRWENLGQVRVEGEAGILDMQGVLVQTGDGRLSVGPGCTLLAPVVVGGRVELAEGSRLPDGAYFENARVTGPFEVASDARVRATESAVLSGPVLVNPLGLAADTRLELLSGSRIEGDVALNANPGLRLSAVLDGGRVDGDYPTIAPGVTVHGSGVVLDAFTNEGLIAADGAGNSIELSRGALRQRGAGALIARNGGRFVFEGMAITGGRLDVADGSCEIQDAALTSVAVTGPLELRPGATMAIGDGTRLDRPLVVPAGIDAPTVVTMLNDTTFIDVLRLDAPPGEPASARFEAERGRAATIGPEGVVEGRGEINGAFGELFLQGTLEPGFGDRTGSMLHTGEMVFAPPARLGIDIAGADDHDAIIGDGRMTLGGTLELRLVDGYQPAGDAAFTVITQGLLSGFIDRIEVDPPTSFGPPHAITTEQTVTVVLCAADRDGDGDLTVFDFLRFQNQFDAGSHWADLDGDGGLTIFDFLAFQTAFDAGCD